MIVMKRMNYCTYRLVMICLYFFPSDQSRLPFLIGSVRGRPSSIHYTVNPPTGALSTTTGLRRRRKKAHGPRDSPQLAADGEEDMTIKTFLILAFHASESSVHSGESHQPSRRISPFDTPVLGQLGQSVIIAA